MAAILPDEIFRVADNPLVVNLLSSNLISMASIRAPGAHIRVFCDGGLCSKRLRKALGTSALDHAGCIRIVSTTGLVNHELLDQLKQLRIVLWKLRGHKAINVLWRAQLGMRLQEDNDMGMRKAMLLKLNGVEEGIDITQYSLPDVFYE